MELRDVRKATLSALFLTRANLSVMLGRARDVSADVRRRVFDGMCVRVFGLVNGVGGVAVVLVLGIACVRCGLCGLFICDASCVRV
jgi:hypothetical protein